jgi:hypothetical protein
VKPFPRQEHAVDLVPLAELTLPNLAAVKAELLVQVITLQKTAAIRHKPFAVERILRRIWKSMSSLKQTYEDNFWNPNGYCHIS